jgi:6-methylsalicylate decarboxylase
MSIVAETSTLAETTLSAIARGRKRMTKLVIDLHHHALLPQFTGDIKLGTVDIPKWSLEDSISFMDENGIDVAALTLSSPGVPFKNREKARRAARSVNEAFAEYVSCYPSRIAAFATLPLPHIDDALSELDYALATLKLDGVGVMSNYGKYFATKLFDPILAALNEWSCPVHIHPVPPALSPEQDFGLPPSLYEFTFETTRVAAQVAYNNVFGRFPRLKLILSHGGGTVPFLAKRLTYGPQITNSLRETAPPDVKGELAKFYFDLAMVSGSFTLPALNTLVDTTHILYGSDFPFMPVSDIAESTNDVFGYGGFDQTDISRIASENALSMLPRIAERLVVKA